MAYFKINDIDFSNIVRALKVNSKAYYNAQTNAAGNTIVDYINTKRTIEVSIIPLAAAQMNALLTEVGNFSVSLSFRDPKTGALEENVSCIVPDNDLDYMMIQPTRTLFKETKLTFQEL